MQLKKAGVVSRLSGGSLRRVFQCSSQCAQLGLMFSLPSFLLLCPKGRRYDWVVSVVVCISIPPNKRGWVLFHICFNLKVNAESQSAAKLEVM